MLEQPLPDLAAWVNYLSLADMPVLRHTAREFARLRENEDRVSGRQVASVILQDPLMTLRVLAYIEAHRRRSQNADITTIDRAVMMIGITPFFRRYEVLPLLEDTLEAHPQAILGLLRVITRARNASLLARDWAVLRHDLDLEEVTVAALLHDSAEILLWCFAPTMMMRVRGMQAQNRSLRSAATQQAVLGICAQDLQLALARAWRLPELLLRLMDEAHATHPRVRNVVCAANLARHLANGWDDAAIPGDLAAASDLLGIGRESLVERIGRVIGMPPPAQQAVGSDSPGP